MSLQNLFRSLMFAIDNIVYSLIPQVYKLFVYLSEINLFSDSEADPIHALVSRIYVLLGVFMLFKVSFSLLQYMIDPNAFSDSSKGFGKLVTNVLVAMVLLVSIPYIFSFAMDAQTKIIQSNAIGMLILGTGATTDKETYDFSTVSDSDTGTNEGNYDDSDAMADYMEDMAKDLQFTMYGAFYSLNTGTSTFKDCNKTSGVLGSVDMANDETCLETLKTALAEYDDTSSYNVNLGSFFKYQDSSGEIQDYRNFGAFDKLLWWEDDGEYVVNYLPIVSFLTGGYVVLLLISYSIDVALRSIKLCFLQMIAPIAVISYIDPKESASNSKLTSWAKECATTYFSVFLRLAVMFLVMFLVSAITSSVLSDGGAIKSAIGDKGLYNMWIYLFMILGAFMFAKQVPNLIESIFGFKMTGELTKMPWTKVNESPLAAGLVGGTLGALGGVAANTIAAGKDFRDNWGEHGDIHRTNVASANAGIRNAMNKFSNAKGLKKVSSLTGVAGAVGHRVGATWLSYGTAGLRSATGGGISAGLRGAVAGYSQKDFGKAATHGRMQANKARNDRDVRQVDNFGVGDQISDRLASFAGVKNKTGGVGLRSEQLEQMQQELSNLHQEEAFARQMQQEIAKDDLRSFASITQKTADGKYRFGVYDGDNLVDISKEDWKAWMAAEDEKALNGQPSENTGMKYMSDQDFDSYVSAVMRANELNQRSNDLEKEIKQREKAINAGPGTGGTGDKK